MKVLDTFNTNFAVGDPGFAPVCRKTATFCPNFFSPRRCYATCDISQNSQYLLRRRDPHLRAIICTQYPRVRSHRINEHSWRWPARIS